MLPPLCVCVHRQSSTQRTTLQRHAVRLKQGISLHCWCLYALGSGCSQTPLMAGLRVSLSREAFLTSLRDSCAPGVPTRAHVRKQGLRVCYRSFTVAPFPIVNIDEQLTVRCTEAQRKLLPRIFVRGMDRMVVEQCSSRVAELREHLQFSQMTAFVWSAAHLPPILTRTSICFAPFPAWVLRALLGATAP